MNEPSAEELSDAQKKTERDAWMMMPPQQDDLAARMDPTKIRARKFNTGKGARAPNQSGGASDIWTETPEQKRQRLANQVLGVTEAPTSKPAAHKSVRKAEDEATARRMQEHVSRYALCHIFIPILTNCLSRRSSAARHSTNSIRKPDAKTMKTTHPS